MMSLETNTPRMVWFRTQRQDRWGGALTGQFSRWPLGGGSQPPQRPARSLARETGGQPEKGGEGWKRKWVQIWPRRISSPCPPPVCSLGESLSTTRGSEVGQPGGRAVVEGPGEGPRAAEGRWPPLPPAHRTLEVSSLGHSIDPKKRPSVPEDLRMLRRDL